MAITPDSIKSLKYTYYTGKYLNNDKPVIDVDVSMGIYGINRSVIEALPRGVAYGFDNLMRDGLARGQEISIRPFAGYWLDIGRPDDYEYANEHFTLLAAKLGIAQ